MAKGSFTLTQNDIGEWWRKKLHESVIEAGKEERELAEQNGNYHHRVPAITVIVDAGWSKRSHKHSYNGWYNYWPAYWKVTIPWCQK